ncbi:MAG: quinoprotein dehydrogenase-associated putative ABC transporter substrate-binding protein [Paracoccus sp. (in: a-proteobacteria)]|nr:quinoprotein dehydrogenase-associated putative ABC transporter substrate-binding protein [Paracoccus sp. (in: a-proteobacteria)]
MRALSPAMLGAAVAIFAGGAAAQVADLRSTSALRVCADPAAVPMSSRAEGGFENDLAELFGDLLGLEVEYFWFPQGMGFVRRTLRDGNCDVVMGYAQGDELVLNTNHYYTSVYGIITRRDSPLAGVDRLSDPALSGKEIGVIAGTPPASHLTRAGLAANMRGAQLFVDRRVSNPAGDLIEGVRDGSLDLAVLWGPVAGPMIRDDDDLQFTPLLHDEGAPRLFYRITMGVRLGEDEWKRQLNSLIRRHQGEIDQILSDWGVPLTDDYGREMKSVSDE